jgi:hypothetical protein
MSTREAVRHRTRPVPAAIDAHTYQIRIAGHLDDQWSASFDDVTLTCHDDGTSTLTAPVADQARLHGILAGLRDLGATLLSLHTLDLTGQAAASTAGRVLPITDKPVKVTKGADLLRSTPVAPTSATAWGICPTCVLLLRSLRDLVWVLSRTGSADRKDARDRLAGRTRASARGGLLRGGVGDP